MHVTTFFCDANRKEQVHDKLDEKKWPQWKYKMQNLKRSKQFTLALTIRGFGILEKLTKAVSPKSFSLLKVTNVLFVPVQHADTVYVNVVF